MAWRASSRLFDTVGYGAFVDHMSVVTPNRNKRYFLNRMCAVVDLKFKHTVKGLYIKSSILWETLGSSEILAIIILHITLFYSVCSFSEAKVPLKNFVLCGNISNNVVLSPQWNILYSVHYISMQKSQELTARLLAILLNIKRPQCSSFMTL